MATDHINSATVTDAEAIARLVNAAYRPAPATAGWTHESALVRGPRIEAARISGLLAQADELILVARTAADIGAGIGACVQIQRRGAVCLLGLLAVEPAGQGSGIGSRMLAHAERHAADRWHCSTVRIAVLSKRPELLSFYRRRGYRPTGAVAPYPRALGIGEPLIDGLTVDTLEKRLG